MQRPHAAHSAPDQPGPDTPQTAAQTRIAELEAELRELQHRAKNSLQLVLSLLKLQAGRIRDPDAREAYEHTLMRIEVLALLYRQLHESGSGTHVDLGRYLEAVCEAVRESTPGAPPRVAIEVASEPIDIGLYEAMPLGLIVAELLTDSLHHGFPERAWVRVSAARIAPDRARLAVEDNGRALPAGFDTSAEDSLMLAEALAGQLGDTLNTETNAQGTTSSLTFPV